MAELKRDLFIYISTVLLAVVILFAFDVQIWTIIKKIMPHNFKYILTMLSRWGLYFFYSIFIGLAIYSFVEKDRKLRGLCLSYLIAQMIFSFALVRCMKIVFARARPGYGAGFTFFSLDSRFNSFPSGHSADAFVSGVFLYYLLKNSKYSKYRFLPLIYASFMALLRVVLSVHYPSDIVAGMAIGVLGAYVILSKRPASKVTDHTGKQCIGSA